MWLGIFDAYQIKELTDASKELQDEKDSITRVGCWAGGCVQPARCMCGSARVGARFSACLYPCLCLRMCQPDYRTSLCLSSQQGTCSRLAVYLVFRQAYAEQLRAANNKIDELYTAAEKTKQPLPAQLPADEAKGKAHARATPRGSFSFKEDFPEEPAPGEEEVISEVMEVGRGAKVCQWGYRRRAEGADLYCHARQVG